MAMIAMTTKSSISVKARRELEVRDPDVNAAPIVDVFMIFFHGEGSDETPRPSDDYHSKPQVPGRHVG
jgi:hypothetical protein